MAELVWSTAFCVLVAFARSTPAGGFAVRHEKHVTGCEKRIDVVGTRIEHFERVLQRGRRRRVGDGWRTRPVDWHRAPSRSCRSFSAPSRRRACLVRCSRCSCCPGNNSIPKFTTSSRLLVAALSAVTEGPQRMVPVFPTMESPVMLDEAVLDDQDVWWDWLCLDDESIAASGAGAIVAITVAFSVPWRISVALLGAAITITLQRHHLPCSCQAVGKST